VHVLVVLSIIETSVQFKKIRFLQKF